MNKKISDFLLEYVRTNKDVLTKGFEMDKKIMEHDVTYAKIENWIKESKISDKSDNKVLAKNVCVVYDGQVDITIKKSIEEISKNNNCIFFLNDDMFATNSLIIAMINKILEEEKINNFVKLYNKTKLEDIIFKAENFDEIICIDDEFKYEYIKNHANNSNIILENSENTLNSI